MTRHWWDDKNYPQRLWGEADWRSWNKAGRPRIPLEARLSSDEHPPLDTVPVDRPTHSLAFSVHDEEGRRRREAERRRREVNRLLQKFGLK